MPQPVLLLCPLPAPGLPRSHLHKRGGGSPHLPSRLEVEEGALIRASFTLPRNDWWAVAFGSAPWCS